MRVILLKDVKGVGKRFEEREVSDGHAHNFLLPQKLAVQSDTSTAAETKQQKEREEAAKRKSGEALAGRVAELAGTSVELSLPANEQGHLFEKLTKEKLGGILKLDARLIELEKPIKELGTFEVPISAGEGKKTSVRLSVKPAE